MTDMLEELIIESELPPLVEQTPAQEVAAILDRLVAQKGYDYIYPYAAKPVFLTDDFAGYQGDSPDEFANCHYVDLIDKHGNIWEPSEEFPGFKTIAEARERGFTAVGSCIVGNIAAVMGGEDVLWEIVGGNANDDAFSSLVQQWEDGDNAVTTPLSFPVRWANDERLMQALSLLQERQDNGWAWGTAVQIFKVDAGVYA